MPDTNMERERHSPLVLVDTEDLTREEWLDWRRRGIGGSVLDSGIPERVSCRLFLPAPAGLFVSHAHSLYLPF